MEQDQNKINPQQQHECKFCGVKFKSQLQLYNHAAFCKICYTPEQRKSRREELQVYVDAMDL